MTPIISAAAIILPKFDPIMVSIGPLDLRWYSLAYLVGLIFAWWYVRRQVRAPGSAMSQTHVDDFLFWGTLGVILGGRFGYVLFYNFSFYSQNPMDIFKVWDGGMSFHGGAAGVVLGVIFFSLKHKLNMFRVADLIAIVTPIGLLLGRLANFVNGELYGRATDVSWAMIFPSDPYRQARHPSQLYEAFLEGIVLFALMMFLWHKTNLREKPGFIAGVFWVGYGVFRFLVEYVREPDAHLGLMGDVISRGQLLSLPMIIFGFWLISVGVKAGKKVG